MRSTFLLYVQKKARSGISLGINSFNLPLELPYKKYISRMYSPGNQPRGLAGRDARGGRRGSEITSKFAQTHMIPCASSIPMPKRGRG